MPLYEYRCSNGHTTEELRKYMHRDRPVVCPDCDQEARRVPSLPHTQPDGMYSYAPNIGSADDFERKWADANARAERTGTAKPKRKRR